MHDNIDLCVCKICKCKCEHEIVFVLICTLVEQFHVHKSYKKGESTLSFIVNFEENMDPSHIHLAVALIEIL